MKTVAVENQKGGVGKTATAIGVGVELARAGWKVGMIDVDPNQSLTRGFGLADRNVAGINEVFLGEATLADVAVSPEEEWWPAGIWVVPSSRALAVRETETHPGHQNRLAAALADHPGWDVAIVDCPPNLGELSLNALVAADLVLGVTSPESDSVASLMEMINTIGVVHRRFNPRLRLAGVVINQYVSTTTESAFRAAELAEALGDRVWPEVIYQRAVITAAKGAQRPVQSVPGREARAVSSVFSSIALRLAKELADGQA